MSSDASVGDGDPEDPLDTFRSANASFQREIEEIDPESPDGQTRLIEATEEFLGAMAAVDPREALKRQTIAIVADNISFMTKRAAESQLNEMIRDHGRRSDERPEITDILIENVVQIEQLISDEAEGDVRYRFVFADGGSMLVDDEVLYSPTKFRRAYHKAAGTLPRFDGDIEYWESVIYELIEEYQIIKADSVGPISGAINDLRSKINSSEAYLDRADAARHSGILIDEPSGDPEKAAERTTIEILSDEVRRICEDHGIETEALRWEMNDRDLLMGSVVQKRFEGKRAYFWQLDREEFREKLIEPPEEYEEPDDPAESGDDEPASGSQSALDEVGSDGDE